MNSRVNALIGEMQDIGGIVGGVIVQKEIDKSALYLRAFALVNGKACSCDFVAQFKVYDVQTLD